MKHYLLLRLAAFLVAAIGLTGREAAAQAQQEKRQAGVHWTFRDIDVQTLLGRLKRFGVELPIPVSGNVTVRLAVGAPWSSIFKTSAYEIEGDLSSAALTVAGIKLETLALHLVYKDGELDLTKMSFNVPGKNGAAGAISGQAQMRVRPLGDLNARLTIGRLPLTALADALPELAGHITGTVGGQFNGHAPVERLRDLSAWQAQGRLTLSGIEALGLPALQASTTLRLERGKATLTELTAEIQGARLRASGQVAVTSPYAFSSRLRVAVPDLAWLNHVDANFRPPFPLAGSFNISADAGGSLEPLRAQVRGNFEGRELKAGKVMIDRVAVPFDGTLDRIRINNLRIDLYGGRVSANLTLPTDRDGKLGVGWRVDNVDLPHAASDLLGQKQPWRGSASGRGQLQVPAARLEDLSAWSGEGQLTFGRGNLLGIDVSRITARIGVADGRLAVSELAVNSALGQVTGSATATLTAPFGIGTALRIADVDFAQLNRLPEDLRPPITVAGRAGISLRAQGTLQPIRFTARGGVASRRLRGEQVVVDSLNFNFQISDEAVQVSQIAGAVYQGRFTGAASLALTQEGQSKVDVTWQQVDVGQLLNALSTQSLGRMRTQGTTSGRIAAQAEGNPREPANWHATANVNLAGMRLGESTLGAVRLEADLDQQVLRLARIATEGGRMSVDGSAQLGLTSPYDFGIKLKIANADLAMANALPISLRSKIALGGTVSLSSDLKGTLDPVHVEGGGKFAARDLRADRARLDSLGFNFTAENDRLTISKLALIAYRGRVDGHATVPLTEDANGEVDVRWQRVNAGGLLSDLRGVAAKESAAQSPSPLVDALSQTRLEGWTWGHVGVQTPSGKLLDPAAWTGDVDLSLAAVRLLGIPVKQAFVNGSIAEGRAELTRLAFDMDGARLRGAARLDLTSPYNFQSKVSLENLQLSELNRLPESLRPPGKVSGAVNLTLEGQGTLEPLEITGKGSVTGDRLEAFGARVDHLAIGFEANQDNVDLTTFRADLYGGQINGDATIALKGDEPGRVDFNWREIDVGQLATDAAGLPFALRGTVGGKLHIDLPNQKLARVSAWTIDAAFDTSPLVARSASLGELHGRLSYEKGLLEYRLQGELLRGAIDLAGRWQPKPPSNTVAVNEGRLKWSDARLDELAQLVGGRTALATLTGVVSVDLPYRHGETGLPVGGGEVAVDDLRYNGMAIVDDVRGAVRIAGDRFEVANAAAAVAGGSLNASGTAFFEPNRRGSFRVSVSNADLKQFLAPWPKMASLAGGNVDVQLNGFFGGRRPLIVSGTLALDRVRAAGFDVSAVRAPINGSLDPASGRGTVQFHGLAAQVAHGRLTGNFDLALADGLGLNGRGSFSGIDLRTLLAHSGAASRLASGKLSGNYTLGGRNVRTANDLVGTFDANLTDAQAMAMPVLDRVLPFLTGGISGSTTFDEGVVRGNLARGVVRIERLSLSSDSAQIYAQGNVALAGRLNLDVTVRTGQNNAAQRTLALVASRVLLVAAPPVGAVMTAAQILSNQVINLEVTGTVRSPTIRVQPVQLLGQEAVQFFLLQALP